MQKREPFLGELPEEFLLERDGWSFHKGKVWLRELMLSVVPWYMERITCPLDVGWHFTGGNGAIPVEAGGGGGGEKGSISITVLLAFCTGKRQLAQKMFVLSPLSQWEGRWMADGVSCCVGRCSSTCLTTVVLILAFPSLLGCLIQRHPDPRSKG